MRNSDPWFDFLGREFAEGRGPAGFRFAELPRSCLKVELWRATEPTGSVFEALAGVLDETGESDRLRSAEPSEALADLDTRLRELRAAHPSIPLLVRRRPDRYLPRSHAWMLGEYFAERDLPLWADLSVLHPARAVDWARNLVETGLACPRLLVQLPPRLAPEDVSALRNSGSWVLAVQKAGGVGSHALEQI